MIGVGGVGMAGLAVLLKSRGFDVSGCDVRASERTHWLAKQGIRVEIGHSPRHLSGVDWVVVTPAVDRENPELRACGDIPVRYRGEVLAEIVNVSEGIAVCGSHGKTTTSTWIARLLRALGESVSWCIGGETGTFPVAGVALLRQSSNRPIEHSEQSNTSPLVVEADESDGTLALYRAKTLVVTNCEYDHPDHFKTLADYVACYETAKSQAGEVIESEALDWELFDCSDCSDCSIDGLRCCLESLPLHNRKNARAAVEVALRRGHRLEDIARELPSVVSELPDRRFQVVWPNRAIKQSEQSNDLLVVTDYAHHPSEIACAVGMARAKCRGVLRVLFQPHRYSRTKALLNDFPAAFADADEVLLCPVYAAFEKPIPGGDIVDLYEACRRHYAVGAVGREGVGGPLIRLCRSCEEAWTSARDSMRCGDLTLLLGAGDIIGLVPRVQNDLA